MGRLRRGQPALRRRRPPRSPPRARRSGCTTTSSSWCPQMLRELRPDLRIGFYLHIPFPPAELFQQLPWRRQILEGLLGADLVGFQLPGGAAELRAPGPPAGRPQDPPRPRLPARRPHRAGRGVPDLDRRRRLRGAGPLRGGRGAGRARSARRSATRARSSSASTGSTTPRASIARLRAFGELIADGHLDVEDAVFVQVATPSRERVEQYRILRDEIDRLVGRINGDLGRIGRPAISYLHSSYPREEMAALYRAADVMVVTPLPRRHEPRRQGVRRLPLRRRRRPGALGVRRRRRRAAAGVAGQPLRHQRHEGGAARGLPSAEPRT